MRRRKWTDGWPEPIGARAAFECGTCGLFTRGWLSNAGVNWHWRTSRPHCAHCKGKAQSAVHKAVRAGEILPARGLACADCGKPAYGFDHRDYTKPLAVDPVCRSCNWHRGPAVRTFIHGSLRPAKAPA